MAGGDDVETAPADAAEELNALRQRNEELERDLQALRDSGDKRAIDAELRLEAQKRGMIDMDGLKLIDGGDLTIDADGTVHGVQNVLTQLRRDKPWLFAAPSSSSVAGVPAAKPARTKLATEMTLDEWRLARSALLQRG